MKLQLALDEMNLVDALRFADKVAEHVDIIEGRRNEGCA